MTLGIVLTNYVILICKTKYTCYLKSLFQRLFVHAAATAAVQLFSLLQCGCSILQLSLAVIGYNPASLHKIQVYTGCICHLKIGSHHLSDSPVTSSQYHNIQYQQKQKNLVTGDTGRCQIRYYFHMERMNFTSQMLLTFFSLGVLHQICANRLRAPVLCDHIEQSDVMWNCVVFFFLLETEYPPSVRRV